MPRPSGQMPKSDERMLSITAPKLMFTMIDLAAKENKRRRQDEFIRRLSASFNNDRGLALIKKIIAPSLKNLYRQK